MTRSRASAGVVAMICGALLAACDGDGGGGGFGDSCEAVAPCGGDVVGQWELQSVCVDGLRSMFDEIIDKPGCGDFFHGHRIRARGTFDFEADGTVDTNASFDFDLDVVLTSRCAQGISGNSSARVDAGVCQQFQDRLGSGETASIAAAQCQFRDAACYCIVTSAAIATDFGGGSYSVQGDQLTLGTDEGGFCVEGDTLRIGITSSTSQTGNFVLARR